MPPLLRYFVSRLLTIPITLFFITTVLYGAIILTPPEVRVGMYLRESNRFDMMTEKQQEQIRKVWIERYHLDDPYPVQYGIWAGNLLQGNWGYSATAHDQVLAALLRRTPVSAELALYAMLIYIPLGLYAGGIAGWKSGQRADRNFRMAAFTATSLPTFIVALLLLAVFYVMVNWFPPERLSNEFSQVVRSDAFRSYTGLVTIDGLLNGRPDVTLDALRHLFLPVVTLSLFHWATLGRITRARMIEELQKEYVTAAKARGLPDRALVWTHAFRNTLSPALASSVLSAASLLTGVYVVEVIFNFKGLSELAVLAMGRVIDAPLALGFAIYSAIAVLVMMTVLDLLQAAFNPKVREGLGG